MMYWWIVKTFSSWLAYRLGGEKVHYLATNAYRSVCGRRLLRR
jgi:L-amino acid N-acyltransferase YncA